jgi:hypothetical protein
LLSLQALEADDVGRPCCTQDDELTSSQRRPGDGGPGHEGGSGGADGCHCSTVELVEPVSRVEMQQVTKWRVGFLVVLLKGGWT